MNRTVTTVDLKALIAAHAAEIAALKVENEKLAQRVMHLEEQLRLERLRRYAPRSEKLTERIFNEAEQAAAEGIDVVNYYLDQTSTDRRFVKRRW
jgi:transposase